MSLHRLTASLPDRARLPRRTIRLRLTALYAGLFLLSGAGLLAITYVLVSAATAGSCYRQVLDTGSRRPTIVTGCASPHGASASSGSQVLMASSWLTRGWRWPSWRSDLRHQPGPAARPGRPRRRDQGTRRRGTPAGERRPAAGTADPGDHHRAELWPVARSALSRWRACRNRVRRPRRAGAAGPVVVVPVGVLFLLLASRRLVRRVRWLEQATLAVADGDCTVTLPASGWDEIARLEANSHGPHLVHAAQGRQRPGRGTGPRCGARTAPVRKLMRQHRVSQPEKPSPSGCR